MKNLVFKKRSGQGLVEYILIVALIAILVIAALKIFGRKVGKSFKKAAETIEHEVDGAKTSGEKEFGK
jgi:Flp pilus assembly pilin Flp